MKQSITGIQAEDDANSANSIYPGKFVNKEVMSRWLFRRMLLLIARDASLLVKLTRTLKTSGSLQNSAHYTGMTSTLQNHLLDEERTAVIAGDAS